MQPDRQGLGESHLPDDVLVCGYVPLLSGEPGRVVGIDDPEALRVLAEAQRCPSGQADAVLWVADAEGLYPVFVLEQADAIADHLLAWSESRVGDWFALCLSERGERFAAALVPNMARVIERFEAARPAAAPGPGGARGFDLLLRPLFFVSLPGHAFGQVRHLVTSPARLGLLDAAAFASAHPPSAALNGVRTVGTVEICRDGWPFGYDVRPLLDQIFAWVTQPDTE
jgi:hypothetical protein